MSLFTKPEQPAAATHGTVLLREFEQSVADHREDAAERSGVVTDRIAALEAELSDLRALQRKLEAASAA